MHHKTKRRPPLARLQRRFKNQPFKAILTTNCRIVKQVAR